MRPQPSHMCRFCRRGVLCLITRQHTLISLGIHRRTQLITPCTTPAVPGSRVPVEKPSLCQACSVEGSWTEAWGTRASTPQLLQIAVVSSVVSIETDICGLPRQCTHTAPTGSCNSAAKLFVARVWYVSGNPKSCGALEIPLLSSAHTAVVALPGVAASWRRESPVSPRTRLYPEPFETRRQSVAPWP